MTTRVLCTVLLATGCLFGAGESKPDEAKQMIQVSDTKRLDFPPGGTLRLKHSTGVLTMEAWDRPDVEITTIKYTKADVGAGGKEGAAKRLQRVNVAAERQGNEVVVTTSFPRFGGFLLEYYIKAPASARIVDEHHGSGNVSIDGLTGDIEVRLLQGEILLHLPEERQYLIHAKSKFGNVNSDFPGGEKRSWWLLGHRSLTENTAATQKLNLKVGFGDIILLRTRVPKETDSLMPVPKTESL